MAKKNFTASINLPVECLSTVIDTNDKNVLVPIEKIVKYFNSTEKLGTDNDDVKNIQSLNTITVIDSEFSDQRAIPFDAIHVEHDVFSINSCKRKPIHKTNSLRFYLLNVEFANGICKSFIVPSYVKFYSYFTGAWIPVEHVRARHILMDYTGSMVKSSDAVVLPDFNMTDYYNIKVMYTLDESNVNSEGKPNQFTCNFYLNGILANISYNNFQILDSNDPNEMSDEDEE